MLYAILCYDDEAVVDAWSKEKDDSVMESLGKVVSRLADERRLGPVARLMSTKSATTVRKGKAPAVLDGPFAETKEHLLGFYVVDCASPDAAVAVAKELADASSSAGAFEIRPLRFFMPGSGVT